MIRRQGSQRFIYMNIIFTPNSGRDITVSVQEREQRGSTKSARGSTRAPGVKKSVPRHHQSLFFFL